MNTEEHLRGKISFSGSKIAFFRPYERVEIDLQNISAILNTINPDSFLLFDHRIPISFSYEAICLLSTTTDIKGLAFLVHPGINEKVAGFLKSRVKNYPVGLFSTEKEAIIWLNRLKYNGVNPIVNPIELNFNEKKSKNVG